MPVYRAVMNLCLRTYWAGLSIGCFGWNWMWELSIIRREYLCIYFINNTVGWCATKTCLNQVQGNIYCDKYLSLVPLVGWVGLWGFLWWAPSAKRKDHHGVSSGWSSVWHRSNTGLSSTQYEQTPIILGVWPFWLTLFFSVNNILAGLWLNCISPVEITLFLLADILLQHTALFQCKGLAKSF